MIKASEDQNGNIILTIPRDQSDACARALISAQYCLWNADQNNSAEEAILTDLYEAIYSV